ncbi:MAG: alpha/beta hydrolase [Gemmataceae bacterium]
MFRKWFTLAVGLMGFVAAWHLLAGWVVAGGERLLYLTPPAFFLSWLIVAEKGWRDIRPHLRPLALLLGVVTVLVASPILTMHFAAPGFPIRWGQIGVLIYFVMALLFLVGAAWWLLGQILLGAGQLISPGFAERRAAYLERHVPAALVVLLLLPFLLAATQVHRFKVPNGFTPRLFDRDFEEVTFRARDGLRLEGWFVPAKKPSARTLLVCHGLNNCRANMLGWLPLADDLNANLFVFDLRGHGDSAGQTVTFGYLERADVCAAVNYLRTQRPGQTRELIGAGISMGAASLIGGAALVDPPFDALVLDSSFATVDGVAENLVAGLPRSARRGLAALGVPATSLLTGCPLEDLRPVDWIRSVRAPVFITHARGDKLIPAAHAEMLYEQACTPKQLWIVPGGDHGSALADPSYFARVKEMVEANLETPVSGQ